MIIARDITEVKEYSLMEDTGENKSVFLIGALDIPVRAYLDDTFSVFDATQNINDVNVHAKYLEFVRFGLKGWKNIPDKDGKEIEFVTEEKVFPRVGKRTIASDESLNKLKLTQIIELGMQVVRDNTISGQDLKN
jgi:hypothetical protein